MIVRPTAVRVVQDLYYINVESPAERLQLALYKREIVPAGCDSWIQFRIKMIVLSN
jgi:hypothetical protein